MVATALAATPESCRDLLQGYLTGRLSSAVGGNQIEALRRQIKTNNDVMTKTIDELKKQFKADLQMIRGVVWFGCLKYNKKAKKICFKQPDYLFSLYFANVIIHRYQEQNCCLHTLGKENVSF